MQPTPHPQPFGDQSGAVAPGGYLLAVTGSALAVAVAAFAERWLGLDDLSLVFMLAVLVVAARTRTGPAVLAAVLCQQSTGCLAVRLFITACSMYRAVLVSCWGFRDFGF